jgi:hypothetical protein
MSTAVPQRPWLSNAITAIESSFASRKQGICGIARKDAK